MEHENKKMIEAKHILFLGDIGRPPIRGHLAGLQKYVRLWNVNWIFYINSPDYHVPDLREITFKNVRQWDIQAIVDVLDNPEKTKELLSMGLPCVNFSRSQTQPLGKYCMTSDNVKIAEMAVEYFLDKKFVNFAYCGVDSVEWSRERQDAFVKFVAQKGLVVHLYEHPDTKRKLSWAKEHPYLIAWLKTLPHPVGMLVGSDYRGKQVLEACQAAGLNVPEEVAVLGIGNEDFFCELARPRLSSIASNPEDVGYKTAELLAQLMENKNHPPHMILSHPTSVIERQSTNILAIDDEMVKDAVQFIHFNSMRSLNAPDVAEALYTTVRTLDRRFKKSLRRSVYSEIARIHIEQVCRLLLETNLSITEIASKTGYSEPKYLTQAFKRETGIAPLVYRRKMQTE